MTRLVVNSGETYTVSSGDTEDWEGATVDGTLVVDGTLELTDDGAGTGTPTPTPAPTGVFQSDGDGIDLPLSVNLPLSSLSFSTMNTGLAIFLVGMYATLGGFAAWLKNYAAGIMLGMAMLALVMSGLLGIGLETHWVMILATVVLLIAGAIVRWIQ